MIKRFFCLLAALMVCASSCFAWNAESFIGDSEFYDADTSLYDASVYAVSSDSDTSNKLTYTQLMSGLTTSQTAAFIAEVYHEEQNIGNIVTVPAWTEYRSWPSGGKSFSKTISGYNYLFTITSTVPSTLNNGDVESVSFPAFSPFSGSMPNYSITFDVDISSLGSFTSFSLDGLLYTRLQFTHPSGLDLDTYASRFDILVNGTLVRSYSPSAASFDFGGYVYSGTSPVTSLQFRFTYDYVGAYDYVEDYLYIGRIHFYGYDSSYLTLSVLSGESVLDGFNDEAQDSLNQHEQYESQWTGSMTENFNKLDISNFTFPVGLVSGFGLLTGIFQDLWNGMGEYKILYVFPLTLGIVLLLVGRISKFAGRSGSSKSDRGDGSA